MKTSIGITLCQLLVFAALLRGQQSEPVPDPVIPECAEMQTTASGIRYGWLGERRPNGTPTADAVLVIDVTTWLADGTLLWTTRTPGQRPVQVSLRRVARGLPEVLLMMREGERMKCELPPEHAYGTDGSPPLIPPNATVVHDVEIRRVMPCSKPPRFDEEEATKLPNGIRVEVLGEGAGDPVGESDLLAVRFAIWTRSGEQVNRSETRGDTLLRGTASTLPWPFLASVLEGRRPGAIMSARVPRALYRDAIVETQWRLEIVDVDRAPSFAPCGSDAVTTASGLRIDVLRPGAGPTPGDDELVTVHLTGWTLDGQRFHDSRRSGRAQRLRPSACIPGLAEAMRLSRPGAAQRIEIPPSLGYPDETRPAALGPDTTIVMVIERPLQVDLPR